MTIDGRELAGWLVCAGIILLILVAGRPLLAPLSFAVLIWAIVNALTDTLQRFHLPRVFAWAASLALIVAALYLFARVMGNEADAVAAEAPAYLGRLQRLAASASAFLHLGHSANFNDILSGSSVASMLGQAAASAGSWLFTLAMVVVYVGFLLAEQQQLPGKLARLQKNAVRRDETGQVIHAIARQVQSYLGVCTLLSAVMAVGTYALLVALHVSFAGFWALVLFLATYVPTVGAVGVLLPALMALLQYGSFGPFLVIAITLGALHFVLANIVGTVMLGRTLNLSPLGIILSLSFWGLIWGVGGLFLAVPITGAFVILCRHIDALNWIAIALAGPDAKRPAPSRKSQ